MWISRKEWQEVQDRLKAVENRLRELSYMVHDATEVTVYAKPTGPYYPGINVDKTEIPISSVLYNLMEKLGLELVYVKGQPTRADLQTKKPA